VKLAVSVFRLKKLCTQETKAHMQRVRILSRGAGNSVERGDVQ
jgi:hypothetical protein